MVCPESENNATEFTNHRTADPSFSACLVEGDAAQRAIQHRLRRRSVLISVTLQIAALAALILAPIFSKTERIAMANNWVPMPPYHRPATAPDHLAHHPHVSDPVHRFHFCLSCSPDLPPEPPAARNTTGDKSDTGPGLIESNAAPSACTECVGLTGNTNPPLPPPVPTPHRLVLTHLDPAMLIHRIEPAYPTLARQTHREGTVELHAIIATDGSVRSLQFLTGDGMFAQSALEAVSQWRYKPTYLNGVPVEVDTRVTVIYRLNH